MYQIDYSNPYAVSPLPSPIFDEDRDLMEVTPDLSTSIAECLMTGVVPAAPSADSYNNIESTDKIGCYAEDNFEVITALREKGISLRTMPTNVDPTKQTPEV